MRAPAARRWLFLFAAFFVATVASRLGIERKSLLGIAEDRGGRRGPGNAFANCGVATVAAAAAVFTPYHAPRHGRDRGRADGRRKRHGRE